MADLGTLALAPTLCGKACALWLYVLSCVLPRFEVVSLKKLLERRKKEEKKKAKIVLSVCATLCFRSSWHQQTQHDSIARKHPGCSVIRKKWWCYCNCMTFKSLRFQEKRVTYVRIQKKKIISSWTESRNKLDPGLHQCLSINPPNVKHCKKEKKKICIETLLCPSNLVLK